MSTIKEDKDKNKWEAQAEKIWKVRHKHDLSFPFLTDLLQLVDAHGMEVFTQYFRRLLQSNASQIFPTASRVQDGSGTYQLLLNEMQKLTVDPQQANKIAESLDTTDGDLFRDFDLSTFMDHFRLDPIAKTTLALACKTTSKPDLRSKGSQVRSFHIHC